MTDRPDDYHIEDLTPKTHERMKEISYHWLKKYDVLDEEDIPVLEDPFSEVIDKGGYFFVGIADGEVVSCAALEKTGDGDFEIAKLAVDERYFGRGYAVKLMEHAIKKAKEAGACRVFLYTNSKLAPALSLYKKLGFTRVDRGESKYPSADMEFELII